MTSTLISSSLFAIGIIVASIFQYNELNKAKSYKDIIGVSSLFWSMLAVVTLYSFFNLIEIGAHFLIVFAKGISLLTVIIILAKVMSLKGKTSLKFIIPVLIVGLTISLIALTINAYPFTRIIPILFLVFAYIYQINKFRKEETSQGISSRALLTITMSTVLFIVVIVINRVEQITLVYHCLSAMLAFITYNVCLSYKPKFNKTIK